MTELWADTPKTSFFDIQVYSFGLHCAVGALAAAASILILCRASRKKRGTGILLAALSILFGLAGARLFFCLLNYPGREPLPFGIWFNITTGGFSLFGMILGVFAAAWICSRLTGEKRSSLLDITACSLPLMIAAERIGEKYFEGFDISRSVMGMFPAGTFLAVKDELYGTYALATWLLSSILSILLFLILAFRLVNRKRKDGDQWILFLILCGAGGVVLESLRYDYHLEYSFVYFQQIIAALMLVWGVVLAGIHSGKGNMFTAAVVSATAAIAACGGIEFALDRTSISHVLLYLIMITALAVPAALGLLLLNGRKKGNESD